jgi:hypothetical protein
MEQSRSWEANSHSASQEFSCFLWNLKVHCHVRDRLPLIPILSQMNPVHNFSPYFIKIYFNIILPSMPMSSELSLPVRFSDKNSLCISHIFYVCYMPRLCRHPWFDHPNKIWRSSSLCSLFQPPATSSLLGPNVPLSTLVSDTLNLCSSLSVWD